VACVMVRPRASGTQYHCHTTPSVQASGRQPAPSAGRPSLAALHSSSLRVGEQVSGGGRRNDGAEKGSAWLSGLGICRPGVIGAFPFRSEGGSKRHSLVAGRGRGACQFASRPAAVGWLVGSWRRRGSRDPARRGARCVRLRDTEWTPFKAAPSRTNYGDACRP
jgi:hypothetical protein